MSGHLDYEKPTARQFAIELIAVDSGSPSLNSTAILNVNITDVNDNAPLFNKSDYSITLLEGANIGEDFTVVTAIDIDEGTNSEVRLNYSFVCTRSEFLKVTIQRRQIFINSFMPID